MKWVKRLSPALVIIPAYNEEANIANVIRDAQQLGYADVLVIDDGSLDRTASSALRVGAYILHLPFNLGIGGAVQAGLKFAAEMGYAYAVRIDGDGQHNMEEAKKLIQVVREGKADVAIGSRFFPGQQTYRPPLGRAMGIRWFAILISLITKETAFDTTSGMQAMNRSAIKLLAMNYPQDYPEVEARVLMRKANLRVIEIPVKMRPRAAGVSSITYLRSIYYMFKVSLSTVIAAVRQAPRQEVEEV